MNDQYQGQSSWKRIIFVALFWVIFYFAQVITGLITIAQCIFVLLSNNPNDQLLKFGDSMSKYINEILRYVTFNSDRQPFPFADFPKADIIIPPSEEPEMS